MNNHFLPFLWIHGEHEATYRKMIGVIQDANIHAFCVEARPHPGFCEQQWWDDLSVILDEAEKRGMKVWILDDKHFPTGFAAGKVKDAPYELKRQALFCNHLPLRSGKRIHLDIKKYAVLKERLGFWGVAMSLYGNGMKFPQKKKNDKLLACVACCGDQRIDLTGQVRNGTLDWTVPDGKWTLEILGITYDSGIHQDYINSIDPASCRIQIDAVYEPHYAHFKDKFGTVIAGFFSDEPELGNGDYTKQQNLLGTEQALPYSKPLENRLKESLGQNWRSLLTLLWRNDGDERETARVRYLYMDAVTRLVEESFSKQIGTWCRERGVEYIGHIIEDNNQHARTSNSMGHYFRALKWQSMAGIDDIGGQVGPGKEDYYGKSLFGYYDDGEFYQFALGKLGSSLGLLNPNMQGRTMCELFGNYGWAEGVHLEKYLLDHFLVRGVNYFVPHAFTCSDYPDKDCPPHFYAQGHNPQYRHFGALMRYGQRICNLISGGRICEEIAILYHGEAEWTGGRMLMQKPARVLMENQFDFCFMPSDVFEEREFYQTKIDDRLHVNGIAHKLVIVPYAQYLTKKCAEGLAELIRCGGKVVFLHTYPSAVATGEPLPDEIRKASVCTLNTLLPFVQKLGLTDAVITPADKQIRILHYAGETELYLLVNESDETYRGEIGIPGWDAVTGYDAWNNVLFDADDRRVCLDAHQSICLLKGTPAQLRNSVFGGWNTGLVDMPLSRKLDTLKNKKSLEHFTLSVCDNLHYPNFRQSKQITKLEGYELTDKKFSGLLRYECDFVCDTAQVYLEITEAYEGVEVFVNGISAGIQVTPRYLYDLTPYVHPGNNNLRIEVATTLERERGGRTSRSGITGEVNLYTASKECGFDG